MEISEIKISLSKYFRLFSIRVEIASDRRNSRQHKANLSLSSSWLSWLFNEKIGKVIYLKIIEIASFFRVRQQTCGALQKSIKTIQYSWTNEMEKERKKEIS